MINEALIQSIVRNIVQRLQDEATEAGEPANPESRCAPRFTCRRRLRTSIRVIELVISTPPPLKSGSQSSLIPACLSNSDDRWFASTKNTSPATVAVVARFAASELPAR